METCYNAKKVSLHVRKSNRGAIRLYEQVLGYSVDSVAKGYYSDGEDAYLMQVELPIELKPQTRSIASSLLVGWFRLTGTSPYPAYLTVPYRTGACTCV